MIGNIWSAYIFFGVNAGRGCSDFESSMETAHEEQANKGEQQSPDSGSSSGHEAENSSQHSVCAPQGTKAEAVQIISRSRERKNFIRLQS